MWATAGFRFWPFVAIVVADVGVLAWTFAVSRSLAHGDRRSRPPNGERGSAWLERVWDKLSELPGPVAWRIVYLPIIAVFALAVIVVPTIAVTVSSLGVLGVQAVLFGAVGGLTPMMLQRLSNTYVGWRAMGLPGRQWLGHAYAASLSVAVILGVTLLISSDGSLKDKGFLYAAVLLLLAVVLPLGAVTDTIIAMTLVMIPLVSAIALGLSEFSASEQGLGPVVVMTATILVIAALLVRFTWSRIQHGSRIRFDGPFQQQHGTYYQLTGAAS